MNECLSKGAQIFFFHLLPQKIVLIHQFKCNLSEEAHTLKTINVLIK